ncbi:XRE family transcriptional regulator [Leuconostoc citreum]|uniref:XRE family transcriptional regulator n=1 Tax=Leuconostoc citreum TaxID=33964 RepID=UPI00200B620A|nr:XRE family transcriptional regulator [Leuconostoc citreum]MCK8605772.1 XRE family transcriptional regulator [Leuconostoc citreum]
MRNIIGPKLKAYRKKNGVSQFDLALKTKGKLSTSTTSTAETEPKYDPRLSTFIEMYRYIDIPFEQLLEELGYGEEYQSTWYKKHKEPVHLVQEA